ncbi:hypothetical protein N9A28_05775 [Sulfurimonas sp.]|nr:hypothetical protein [Sulfurimonas sp.]
MSGILKYANIEEMLPNLPKVLLNTIQSDVLEIKSLDKTCGKYMDACKKTPELDNADFVVYSKYMDKANHKYEKFIFLAKDGSEVCDVSGQNMELYGLLACTSLSFSQAYEASLVKT